MSKLIALVTVVAFVDGVRTEFPAGSELPALAPHDVTELKRMNAVQDTDDRAAEVKAEAAEQQRTQDDLDAERKALQDAADSIKPAAEPNEQPVEQPAASATPATKKKA